MSSHSPINNINLEHKKTLYPLKDQFRCMFCGGQKCPNENYLNNKNTAIIGLNCDLIDGCIYASQRPSNVLIKKYNLIQVFRQNNIGLIINLQRPGEHPYCGPNNLDKQSGYSYTPSLFVSEGIKVKLSGWKDMDVPDSLYFMLDIIKEMTFVIKVLKMRVFVHCHSGLGRTGIVIACYKIFNDYLTTKEAIKQLRDKRPKSIEKTTQIKYCNKFYEFLRRLRITFTSEKTDINIFLKHQEDLLFNLSSNNSTKYIPKVIFVCLESIKRLMRDHNVSHIEIYKALNGSTEINDEIYANILSIARNVNNGQWEKLIYSNNLLILSEALFIWLDESVNSCIYPSKIKELFELTIVQDNLLCLHQIEKEFSQDKYLQIQKTVQLVLRPYEYDILNYFSSFLSFVYPPDDNNSLFNEYHYMVEKIAIFLVGYTIDLLYDQEANGEKNISHCFVTVERTISLLEFLRQIHYNEQYHLKPTETIKTIDDRIENNKSVFHKEISIQRETEKDLFWDDEPKVNKDKDSEKVSHYSNDQERHLYSMYQILKKHFESDNKKELKMKFDFKENNIRSINDCNENDLKNEKQINEDSCNSNEIPQDKVDLKQEVSYFFLSKRRSTTKLKYRFPIPRPKEYYNSPNTIKSQFYIQKSTKENKNDKQDKSFIISNSLCIKDA